jgi:hypothetical protein
MPRSKHRHKKGGKAIRHPGRVREAAMPAMTPEELARRRFSELYTAPFFRQFGHDDPRRAGLMLDIIAEAAFNIIAAAAFNMSGPALALADMLVPVSRQAAFEEFMALVEEEGKPPLEMAEAALGCLVEQRMVLVDDDRITVHPRFLTDDTGPAQTDTAGPEPEDHSPPGQ